MSYSFVVCMSLVALCSINILASAACTVVWHCLSVRADRWSAALRSRLLFALRLFPTTAALVVVLLLFVPSYVLYEPRPADEMVGLKLAILASVSSLGIGLAVWRGLASFCATRRLVAEWMDRAEAVTIQGCSLPCFGVAHPFPVVAVVGIFRPRLFLSQQVLKSLRHHELLAALEHETGHVRAQDNLKRLLMACCRDLLGVVRCGRSLDHAWRTAAEAAADEYAARRGGRLALDLADALVKLARMVPEGVKPVLATSGSLIGDDGGEISTRVHRLAQIAERGSVTGQNTLALNALTWSWLYLLFLAAMYVDVTPRILESLHGAMESFFPLLN
jgi:Zn-dependent protease with chaperone function